MAKKELRYKTYAHLPEIQAACLRVMVLDDAESGIDTLPDWVRFRITDAAKSLDECHERIAALERYVSLVQSASSKAFSKLAKRFAAESATDGR